MVKGSPAAMRGFSFWCGPLPCRDRLAALRGKSPAIAIRGWCCGGARGRRSDAKVASDPIAPSRFLSTRWPAGRGFFAFLPSLMAICGEKNSQPDRGNSHEGSKANHDHFERGHLTPPQFVRRLAQLPRKMRL